jgi:hypothetical protein
MPPVWGTMTSRADNRRASIKVPGVRTQSPTDMKRTRKDKCEHQRERLWVGEGGAESHPRKLSVIASIITHTISIANWDSLKAGQH